VSGLLPMRYPCGAFVSTIAIPNPLLNLDISLYSLPLISDDSLPGIQSKVYHFVCRLI
jgi:hypothetical protein